MLKITVKVLLLAFLIGGIFFLAFYPRTAQTGIYRDNYEGRVVDKWVNVAESQQGSRLQGRLLVESNKGERFEVAVSRETYESAQPGMEIRRGGGKVELWWSSSPQSSADKR